VRYAMLQGSLRIANESNACVIPVLGLFGFGYSAEGYSYIYTYMGITSGCM
jgi:hypothetical protein